MAMFTIVGFKTEYKNNKAVDWVQVAPTGEAFDKTRTWHRVEKLRPRPDMDEDAKQAPTNVDMIAKWSVIEPAYEAWKAGTEVPENGVPLAAWSGVSTDEAEFLRKMGIRTVEEVAEMSTSATDRVPFPNARKLPKLAKDFLAGKGQADLQAELEAMKERNAAMEAMLEEMAAKKPGRPKKDKEAA